VDGLAGKRLRGVRHYSNAPTKTFAVFQEHFYRLLQRTITINLHQKKLFIPTHHSLTM